MNRDLIESGMNEEGFSWEGGPTVNLAPTGFGVSLAEAQIGPPNFKAIWWLNLAVRSSKHVCRVVFDLGGSASGFLIGDDLLMTNNHVFGTKDEVASSKLQFNYEIQADRTTIGPVDEWEPDPDRLITNANLDYSVVGVKKKDGKNVGEVWGHFILDPNVRIIRNQRANIIQHPQGRTKEIAFRDNQVKYVDEEKVQYLEFTEQINTEPSSIHQSPGMRAKIDVR